MGERGRTRQLGERIGLRLSPGDEAKVRMLAEIEGVSLNSFLRQLIREGLVVRCMSDGDEQKVIRQATRSIESLRSMLTNKTNHHNGG